MGLLAWTKAARQLQQRLVFLHALDADWPDASDTALLEQLETWLAPFLDGARRRDELQRLELGEILLAMLPWERRAALERLAPTHLAVPSGSRIAIDYDDPSAPVLAVRLQEMFGLHETPRIGGGRVPLTLHLLSPAQRPVQVTKDLANFWRATYFEEKRPQGSLPEALLARRPTASRAHPPHATAVNSRVKR